MRELFLNTVTIKQAALEDRFRLASRAGFAGLELWTHEIDGGTEQVDKIARLSTQYQLKPVGICPEPAFHSWHHAWNAGMSERLRTLLAACRQLGPAYLVLPVLSANGSLELLADCYHRACDLCGEFEVVAALEPIGHVSKLSSVPRALDIVATAAARHPNAGLILDAFHFFRGRNKLSALVSMPIDLIAAVHLNDAEDRPLDSLLGYKHRTYPGEGIFDITGFCRRLITAGYEGPFVVELLNEVLWADNPAQVCDRAFATTAGILKEAARNQAGPGAVHV